MMAMMASQTPDLLQILLQILFQIRFQIRFQILHQILLQVRTMMTSGHGWTGEGGGQICELAVFLHSARERLCHN